MGDFSVLTRLGLDSLLSSREVEVVQPTKPDLVGDVVQALPDVVLLNLDNEASVALAFTIAANYPAVRSWRAASPSR